MLFGRNENRIEDIEKKQLEFEITQLRAQMEGLKQFAINSETKNKQTEKAITSFCRSLLQKEFALSQIGGSEENVLNMNIPDLLNFTAKKILEQKSTQDDMILKTMNISEEKEKIIDGLQKQLTQILQNEGISKEEITKIVSNNKDKDEQKVEKIETEENKSDKKTSNQEDIIDNPLIDIKAENKLITDNIEKSPKKEDTPSVKVIEIKDEDLVSDNKKNLKNNMRKRNNRSDNINNKQENKEVKAHIIDLNKTIDNLAEIHWDILNSIGKEGLSEKADISKFLSQKYTEIEKNSLDQKIESALNEMVRLLIINREKVSTGRRTFFVYSLSDTGKRICKESDKFDGEPILCEKELLVKEHSSIMHGYGIKDCASVLEELGFKDICYDSRQNKIELSNGDIYIPDIVARNPKTGEKEYFEYELVHHKQTDFNRKCNKMYSLTNSLHFIVPDVKLREKIMTQVDTWRYDMGNKLNENVVVYVTTTRNLQKDKWAENK